MIPGLIWEGENRGDPDEVPPYSLLSPRQPGSPWTRAHLHPGPMKEFISPGILLSKDEKGEEIKQVLGEIFYTKNHFGQCLYRNKPLDDL